MSDKEDTPEKDVQGPSSSLSAAMSNAERMKMMNEKIRQLSQKRNETRKANKADVVEEDRKIKNPKHVQQEVRREWDLNELEEKKKAEELGVDFERAKAMSTSADAVWKRDAAKKRKKNPNQDALVTGDYETMSLRQNDRLTREIKPNFEEYKRMREVIGEEQFYPSVNTITDGAYYPTPAALDRLSNTVHEMVKTREKVHRRRMFDPDSEVTYINEKNRVFNKKLDTYYGKYTEDLREDLERGTAL
ncbi:unnamed protein product, partial [Mesorhabditis belari]|uniref:Pre-mRNA-splicing factor SYF2 n=1 Tax=Mesorhabditis belari TaxID=2138241 RepID=A0AAF3FIV2_9BILA